MITEPFDGLSGEQPMSAGHRRFGTTEVLEPLQELDDGPSGGNLVVEDDRSPAGHVADDGIDDHAIVGQPLLGPGSDREAEEPGELGGGFGVAEIG